MQITDDLDKKAQQDQKTKDQDEQRIETNKTDPQLTELGGFFNPDQPLEEKGTPNPLLGTTE